MKRVTVQTSQGEAEAISEGNNDWEINTPWSSQRFHGTLPQARAQLRRVIHAFEIDEAAEIAKAA